MEGKVEGREQVCCLYLRIPGVSFFNSSEGIISSGTRTPVAVGQDSQGTLVPGSLDFGPPMEPWPDPAFLTPSLLLSLPGMVQRGHQPHQPRRLIVVPRGHPGGGSPDQLWAPRPPVGHPLGGAGVGPGRNQQERPQRWADSHSELPAPGAQPCLPR